MILGTATQTDLNDTSVSPEYLVNDNLKAKQGIVSEWIYSDYNTTEDYMLDKIVSIAQGTVISRSLTDVKIESKSPNKVKQAVIEKLEQRIFRKLRFPDHWSKEGISRPNAAAKEKCLAYCKEIFEKYFLIPDLILSSKEEGIYISYDLITDDFNRTLILEIYNNLEAALIICDNDAKKTVYSEDLSEMNFENAIKVFKA